MAQFVKHYVQDLMDDIKIRQGGTIVFSADDLSNIISVDIYENGEPATLSGSVVGACIRSNGTTVPIENGSISGNTVSITLTASCFIYPGNIGVGIQIVSGTKKTTVLKAIYNVELFKTNTVVDPSSEITLEVSDLIDDINNAIATIPADYTDLMAAVAPTFDPNGSYIIGQCVWNDGKLYRFTAAHTGPWSTSDVALTSSATEIGKAVSYAYDQTITITQQNRARTNIAAAALPALDLGNKDIADIPSSTDLNTLTTPGTYRVQTASVAATLTHTPVTTENFRFVVSYCVNTNSMIQALITRATNRVYTRTGTTASGTTTWQDWTLLVSEAEIDALQAVSYGVQTLTDAEKTQARTNIGAISSADLAALKAVSYDAQTLTDSEKTQARTNIGAPSATDVNDAIQEFGNNVAAEFSTSNNYIAGQYVRNEGTLYRFTAYHAAGAWIGTDAEAIAIANDVSGLIPTQTLNGIRWTIGSYVGTNGTIHNDNNNFKISDLIPCYGQSSVTVVCDTANSNTNAVSFYGIDHKYISGVSNIGTQGEPQTVNVPASAYFLRLTARKAQTSAYVDFGGTTALRPLADMAYLNRYEYDSHIAQFDRISPFTFVGGRPVTENTDSYFDGMPGDFKPFEYPSAFTGTYKPVTIFTDGKHYVTDFNAERFKNTGGNTVYAARGISGNNAGGRTTPKSLYRALSEAQNGDTVILLSGVYTASDINNINHGNANNFSFDKKINIIGEGDVRFLVGGVIFSGTYDTTDGLWVQTRANVKQIIDTSLKFRWSQQTSKAACQALPGSWYTDNSTVYINAPQMPDVYLLQNYDGLDIAGTGDGRIYFENITIVGGSYNIYVDTEYEAIFNKCNFLFSFGGTNERNGCYVHKGHVLFNQCRAAYTQADGFGYTPGSSSTECQFVEIECVGHDCGLYSNSQSNRNGSTCHSGTRGIRINGLYYDNVGGNVADVQTGTMTLNLGCVARNSKAIATGYSQGFSAQQSGAIMWCYACEASGNLYDMYAVSGATLYAIDCVYNAGNSNVTTSGGNHIALTDDLDNYRTVGYYICGFDKASGDSPPWPSNVPTGLTARFTLQVVENGYHPIQVLYTEGNIFMRRSNTTGGEYSWKSWYKFEGTVIS